MNMLLTSQDQRGTAQALSSERERLLEEYSHAVKMYQEVVSSLKQVNVEDRLACEFLLAQADAAKGDLNLCRIRYEDCCRELNL